MKTNLFTKIAVSAMAVALGAGVVGSISGTVAWFQYSTRSTVAYQGAAAHCTENLQISADGKNWKSDLTSADLKEAIENMGAHAAVDTDATKTLFAGAVDVQLVEETFLAKSNYQNVTFVATVEGETTTWKVVEEAVVLSEYGITLTGNIANGDKLTIKVTKGSMVETLKPVTTGKLAVTETPTKFYDNPIYQYGELLKWGVAQNAYVDLNLQLRVLDVDGGTTEKLLPNKPIYLTDLDMAAGNAANSGLLDLSPALRVSIAGKSSSEADYAPYATFANVDDATHSVDTFGYLDLNKDGAIDVEENYEWQKVTSTNIDNVEVKGTPVKYGAEFTVTKNVEAVGLVEKTFLGAVEYKAGTYAFNYDGTAQKWKLGAGEAAVEVDPTKYGITAGEADAVTVTVAAVANENLKAVVRGKAKVAANTDKGIADDTDPLDIKGAALGSTNADGIFYVQVRIYLEGWEKIDNKVLWDAAKTINSKFNVGLRFSTQAHQADE